MTPLKRIVLILGGKGGTGKTALISALYYSLVKVGVKCTGYDADIENPVFAASHEKQANHLVQEVDILGSQEARDFLINLEKLGDDRPEVVLFDMPGASGESTRAQIERFKLFKAAELLGYRITVCAVLNLDIFAINSVDAMLAFCGNQADYVVVKNLIWTKDGGAFDRWAASSTKKTFDQLKGIEIELPILEPVVFKALRDQSLSFFDQAQFGFADRLLTESFLDRCDRQLAIAAPYFGFPIATAEPTKKGTQ
jgi:CobQ/CobB/MinD/ParA nucleotide binding domain